MSEQKAACAAASSSLEPTTLNDLPLIALEDIARRLGVQRYEIPCARKRGVWSPVRAFAATSKACVAGVAAGVREVVLTSESSFQMLQRNMRLQGLLKHAVKVSVHTDAAASLTLEQWDELADMVERAQPRFESLYVGSTPDRPVPFGALGRILSSSRCGPRSGLSARCDCTSHGGGTHSPRVSEACTAQAHAVPLLSVHQRPTRTQLLCFALEPSLSLLCALLKRELPI